MSRSCCCVPQAHIFLSGTPRRRGRGCGSDRNEICYPHASQNTWTRVRKFKIPGAKKKVTLLRHFRGTHTWEHQLPSGAPFLRSECMSLRTFEDVVQLNVCGSKPRDEKWRRALRKRRGNAQGHAAWLAPVMAGHVFDTKCSLP